MQMSIQQLNGPERDEVSAIALRLQQAARRSQPAAVSHGSLPELVPVSDLEWAQTMQLPREFFEYFVLDRAA